MGTIYQNPYIIEGIMDMSIKYKLPMITSPWMFNVASRIKDDKFVNFTSVECIYKIEGEAQDPFTIRKNDVDFLPPILITLPSNFPLCPTRVILFYIMLHVD